MEINAPEVSIANISEKIIKDGCNRRITDNLPYKPSTLDSFLTNQITLDPNSRHIEEVMNGVKERLKKMTFKLQSFEFSMNGDTFEVNAVFSKEGYYFPDLEPIYEFYIRKLALNKFHTCMGDKTLPVRVNAKFKN